MATSGVQTVGNGTQRGLVAVDGRTYPLKSAAISSRAGAGVAATTLLQEFENPYAEPLEAIYTLPLPADGAVIGYAIQVGERRVVGEIEVREKATRRYAEALAAGRIAGLLEQERADTFTQRVGNVPPGVAVRVEIQVLQPLAFVRADGAAPEWEWRFPTAVGPRYLGPEGRVPDGGRIDPPRAASGGTPARVSLALEIADGPAAEIAPHSPSHALRAAAAAGVPDATAAPFPTTLSLADAAHLDRDVIVRWKAAAVEPGVRLAAGPGLLGDPGRYAVLTITPPAAPRARVPRSLAVLLDASGSMGGKPIEHAKAVAIALLDGLGAGDRFEVIAFASQPTRLTGGLVDATPDAVAAARERVRRLSAGGGTEMLAAVEQALAPTRAGEQRQVVLLTDGEIGFEAEVVGKVLRDLPAASRVHVVGVGSAPNRALTRGLSRAGRGLELLIPLGDDPSDAAARLRAATEAPVLVNVAASGSAVASVVPERACDVYAGRPLTLLVELRNGGGAVELTGTLAGAAEPWRWSAAIPAAGTAAADTASASASAAAAPAIPAGALYGRERIEDLEMRLAAASSGSSEVRDLESQIEAAGLRHRVVSRRTSLVAISEEPAVDPQAPRRRVRLAVELPEDVSAEGTGYGERPMRVAGLTPTMALCEAMREDGMILTCERSPGAIGRESRHGIAQSIEAADLLPGMVEPTFGGTGRPRFIEARALIVDGDRLLLEFEVPPGDPLEMPGRGTPIVLTDGPDLDALRRSPERLQLIEADSTRPATYDAGLTLRLALEGPDWAHRLAAGLLFIAWKSAGELVMVVVHPPR